MSDWDSLENDAAAESKPRNQCSVYQMLQVVRQEHGPKAVVSIYRTMANTRLTSASIRKALGTRVNPEDLPSQSAIQRHRRKICNCESEPYCGTGGDAA